MQIQPRACDDTSEFKQTQLYDVDVVEDVNDTIAKSLNWRCRIQDATLRRQKARGRAGINSTGGLKDS